MVALLNVIEVAYPFPFRISWWKLMSAETVIEVSDIDRVQTE